MTTSQVTVKTLAALALVAGFASTARALTPEEAFRITPKQPGVPISTPAPDAAGRCKVTPIPNPKAKGQNMGYLVTDPDGKPVRQFVTYDNKSFNIVSFYLDGVEAYREVYPTEATAPFQFRWLGPNGSKWGLDRTRDFKIDEWAVISPEEVSQELFKAVQANDVGRMVPLMLNREHLAGIGLPAAQTNELIARTNNAGKRFADAHKQLAFSDKAKWGHADFGIPQTKPADSFGAGSEDFTSYKNGTAFVVEGDGKNVLFQTGELVQVGRSWKVVDGPAAGAAGNDAPMGGGLVIEPAIKALVEQLNAHDAKQPNPATVQALAAHNAERAAILEKVVEAATAKETWTKMLIDSHQQAAEGGKAENEHIKRVRLWRDVMAKPNGNPTIAAYAAYRLLIAENSIALRDAEPKDYPAVQERWRTSLEEFVKGYGTSADAPEAVLRLAMAWEMSGGKDADAKAKEWFGLLAKNYAGHAHATKANGALKRLDSEGKPLELTGPALANPAQQVSAAQKDKVVVVYYWASWSDALAADAKKLDAIVKAYEAKGLVLVTVGLDHDAKAASEAVTKTGLPGTHLVAPGGLDASPLAAAYGITAPPHVFVAGKDGKITNRNAHVATLEEEVKKLLEAK